LILHAPMEEGRIGRRGGNTIFGGCHSGRRAGCGTINITKYVAAFEVWNDLRQPDRVVNVGEFGRIKIGEGHQRRSLVVGGDNNRRRVGVRWWL
jgi:hypothetical protein